MRFLNKISAYLIGPALIGLIAAIAIYTINPDLSLNGVAPSSNNNQDQTITTLSGPVSYADAVNRASPSVVNIYTIREQQNHNPLTHHYPSSPQQILPSGSGVIVSEEGYIITNLHVLELARGIRVALQDGREATPKIIGASEKDDMAVLKIDLDGLKPIELGDPDAARVGDVVLAIGNPFGVGQTVTQGIISGTRRKGLNIAFFENFIQTDAAINPGNSGGALVDAYGRLLGINIGELRQTSYGEASGIGFAIPADRAVQAMLDIVEYGRVVRGWLGVSALDNNPQLAKELELSIAEGVFVQDIYLNGPADIAGLLPNDIILSINGNSTPKMSEAIQEFANLRPGDVINIEVLRGSSTQKLTAVLATAPAGS